MQWRYTAIVGACFLTVASANAQDPISAPGERQPLPRAVDGWQSEITPQQLDIFQPEKPTVGWRSGSWTIVPSITVGAFYDDNVFASNRNRRSDWAAVIRPELFLRSVGPQHNFEAAGALDARRYSKFKSENQLNGTVAAGGTVMTDPNGQLQGRVRYLHGHEERNSGEASIFGGTDRPIGFNQFEAAGAINRRFDRFWTSVGAAGVWTSYQTPTIFGIPIPQDYRDGVVSVYTGRVGYVVAPLTSIFIEWAGNQRNFEIDTFDSRGHRIVGGVMFEPGPGAVVRGEAFGGYMTQNYSGPTFQTVSTWTVGANLGFALTPRLTAVIEARREAKESALNPTLTVDGGVSVIESLAGGRLDFALRPNLILGVGATYLLAEYQGADRRDASVSPLVSLKYLVSPNLTLGIDYRNVNFNTSGIFAGLPYHRNVLLFSTNATF